MSIDGLRVQREQCATCIFRKESPLDLKSLLDQVRDRTVPGFLWFKGHRICHHSEDAVCAGFWARYKDLFQLGQIAQRLGMVCYVQDDNQKGEAMSNRSKVKHEQRRERRQGHGTFTRNLMAEALRATGHDVPATMTEAVRKANENLEPKRQLPLTFTKPVPKNVAAAKPRRAIPDHTSVLKLEIPEADVLRWMAEAVAAGRSAITPTELSEMLARVEPVNYGTQRGFVKWL
jgi:hypothetical protein